MGEAGGPGLTHVVCDEDAFTAGRALKEMEGIFLKHPLKEKASSVKVRTVCEHGSVNVCAGRGYSLKRPLKDDASLVSVRTVCEPMPALSLEGE